MNLNVRLTMYLVSAFLCMPVQNFNSVYAQSESTSDWPCIQRLVPTVEAAVLWPGAIDETIAGKWSKDAEIFELARNLGDLDEVDDETRASIESFANAQPAEQLEGRLNMLAEGVLSVANERRSLFINGIKRYTKQQIAVAAQIEKHRNTLHDMDVSKVAVDDPARQEVEQTVHWHQRVFDKREKAIIALCNQPVAVEENLGEVLREIAQYLP